MLMEATKFCKQKYYFSDICLSRWWPGGRLTDITMCKRHQGSTWQTESVSQRVGCRLLNEFIRLPILTRFLCPELRKILFSRTQKMVKLNITQIKKLWLLALVLAKKNFLGFKEIGSLSFKNMEFVLTRNHFCNWCWSSNYWDFFNRKKSSCLNRSYWNSCGLFIP